MFAKMSLRRHGETMSRTRDQISRTAALKRMRSIRPVIEGLEQRVLLYSPLGGQ